MSAAAANANPLASRAEMRRPRWNWIGIGAVGLCLVGLGAVLRPNLQQSWQEQTLRQAAIALTDHRLGDALSLAQSVLDRFPDNYEGLLIAGHATAASDSDRESLAYFQRALAAGPPESIEARFEMGLRSVSLGRVEDAETHFRRVLELDPGHIEANRQLDSLLQLEGRCWESLHFNFEAMRSGSFSIATLQEFTNTETIWKSNHEFEECCLAEVPSNRLPLLGRARKSLLLNNNAHAAELLRDVTRAHPNEMEAQARLGRLLIDSDVEFLAWHQGLSAAADEHPEIWFTRGLWAKRNGQSAAAARCFWETLRRYPDHVGANHQLALALGVMGRPREAALVADRAQKLDQVRSLAAELGNGYTVFRQLVELLESLGRNWEAASYSYISMQAPAGRVWAEAALARLAGKFHEDTSLSPTWDAEIQRLDLSREPLPNWTASTAAASVASATTDCQVAFVDAAEAAGLNFRYYNGADPQGKRVYMFEYSGGGVAVLDYDADGWPDVYLTQGCSWPVRPEDHQHQDRLFRNLGNGRFADVTASSGLGDQGMSHGVTVGDYNNDGYPDLYVANIGPNRCYLNLGDGTFRDVTAETGAACEVWSSSCVLADFNGDSFPDLYVVNYLAPEVLEHQCDSNGRPVQCGPMSFNAEQDRFYLNLGDGRFREQTKESGIVAPNGKGLAVVAADFDGSHRLGLFVANDTTPNFFFRNLTAVAGDSPQFEESALFQGVACDELGRAQSCMGVAAGDVNEDGLLDLFVTNFIVEANAMYVQNQDHSFNDRIKQSELLTPGYHMMGWGTQCLDGELDGRLDLAVANGHLNDYSTDGTDYKMRAQYFYNRGQGRFAEVTTPQLGPYFQRPQLGRAMARLDWNRDGLEDLCVTHVDQPTALLTNRTTKHGGFLAIQLRAVHSARDAIGTTVRVITGVQTRTQQLTAGDGFYASNERLLVFGLGESRTVDRVEVLWPSGATETFTDLPINSEFLLIETRQEPVLLRGGS